MTRFIVLYNLKTKSTQEKKTVLTTILFVKRFHGKRFVFHDNLIVKSKFLVDKVNSFSLCN